jgi:sulfatase maturation enzyme AslB (radical SAM superfamily)
MLKRNIDISEKVNKIRFIKVHNALQKSSGLLATYYSDNQMEYGEMFEAYWEHWGDESKIEFRLNT